MSQLTTYIGFHFQIDVNNVLLPVAFIVTITASAELHCLKIIIPAGPLSAPSPTKFAEALYVGAGYAIKILSVDIIKCVKKNLYIHLQVEQSMDMRIDYEMASTFFQSVLCP